MNFLNFRCVQNRGGQSAPKIEEFSQELFWRGRALPISIAAAGGISSYMSPISFANILMMDFKCIIIPRYVYADKSCFLKNSEIVDEIKSRIKELVEKTILLANTSS